MQKYTHTHLNGYKRGSALIRHGFGHESLATPGWAIEQDPNGGGKTHPTYNTPHADTHNTRNAYTHKTCIPHTKHAYTHKTCMHTQNMHTTQLKHTYRAHTGGTSQDA